MDEINGSVVITILVVLFLIAGILFFFRRS